MKSVLQTKYLCPPKMYVETLLLKVMAFENERHLLNSKEIKKDNFKMLK